MTPQTISPPRFQGILSHYKPAIIGVAILVVAIAGIWLLADRIMPGGLHTVLYHYTAAAWTRLSPPGGAPGTIRITANGEVWVINDAPGGLSRLKDGAWQHYDGSNFGSGSNHIWGGFAVDGDRVWASVQEGIVSFDGQKWRLWREAVKTRGGRAITAYNGEVWTLDEAGNFSHFSKGAWRIERVVLPGAGWKQTAGVGQAVVMHAGGTLWIAWNGLWRFDGRNWTAVGSLPEDAEVASAVTDHVWMEQHNRLWEFDFDGRLIRTLRPADLGFRADAHFYAVAESGDRLTVATSEGLAAWEGGGWKHLPPPARDIFRAWRIALAPDGSLWAICLLPVPTPSRGPAILILVLSPIVLIGFFVVPYLFVRGSARKKLAERARMRSAVEYATGAVPEELQGDPEALKVTPLRWALRALLSIGAAVAAAIVLRKYWPSAAPFGLAGGIVTWEAIGVAMRHLKRREAKPSDPIGPGGPPKFNLHKAAKPILGGLALLAVLYALPHGLLTSPLLVLAALVIYTLALSSIGQRLENQGRYDAALRLAPFADPTKAGRNRLRADVLTEAGRYQEAERRLREVIESSNSKTDSGLALENLGKVLMETGRFEEAQRSFEGAAGINPARSTSWSGRAELLLRQGLDPQKALEHSETALGLFRRNMLERLANRTQLGVILSAQAWALAACGRGAEARQAIEEALHSPARKTKSPLAHVRYNAGRALLALGDRSGATEHFTRAAELDPSGRWGRLAAAMLGERSAWCAAGM